MIGAPALAGLSALRAGAGLVQLAVPRAVLHACLTIVPECIGLGTASRKNDLLDAAEKADAVVIGPGFGQALAAKQQVGWLGRLNKPMVVDADALNILSKQKRWPTWFKARAVLTPHPGEMGRLAKLLGLDSKIPSDPDGRIAVATQAAQTFGQVVVLKGHRTVVTDGDRVYVNQTGNSALSKAGTGDVLSGLLGCLLAQNMGSFEAATAATWVHGRAGEIVGERMTLRGALARDVIDAIPAAIAAYEKRHRSY